jgi:hypothetical protein
MEEMFTALKNQFPLAFVTFFLSGLLPYVMLLRYLDAPIFLTHLMMAVLFAGSFTAHRGSVAQAALDTFLWGILLLATALIALRILDRTPIPLLPPWDLTLAGIAMLAGSAWAVASVAARDAEAARWFALITVTGVYFVTSRLDTNEAEVLFCAILGLVMGAFGWWRSRRPT